MNDRPQQNNKPTKGKKPIRRPTQPTVQPDDGRDLRHVRPRSNQPEDLQRIRQQERLRRRRKLMITRMLIVFSIVLIVLLIALAVVIKIRADQKSAKREPVKFLAVKEIVVEGNTRYTDEEIIEASTLYVGQSLLSVNKANAGKALIANLPYLDGNQVVVDNASFSTLRIQVAEVPAVAAVKVNKDWMILGANNRALEKVSVERLPDDLVRIEGATLVNDKVGKTLLDDRSLRICSTLIVEADRYNVENMTTIDITAKTKISLRLDERLEVVLGGENNLPNQMKALSETLPTLYQNNGEDAAGRLNMIFYSDDDKSNDKSIYTPQEVLDKLEQEEKKPMAAVQTGDLWAIINDDNVVLESVAEENIPADLVRIEGGTYEVVVVGKELLDVRSLFVCHTLIQEANRQETVRIEAIDIGNLKDVFLRLEGGLQVRLGEPTALEAQVKALAEALPTLWENNGEDAAGVLDLTSYADDDAENDKAIYTPPTAE